MLIGGSVSPRFQFLVSKLIYYFIRPCILFCETFQSANNTLPFDFSLNALAQSAYCNVENDLLDYGYLLIIFAQ